MADEPGRYVYTYRTTYSCEYDGVTDSVDMTVHNFFWSTAPQIGITAVRTQIGPDDAGTDFGSDAACNDPEEGALAVTSTVAITGSTATITYMCEDRGGQSAAASQQVSVAASAPPGMYLNEPGIYYLSVGDAWTDPGAYCIDAEDGRVAAEVLSDNVDTSVAGDYRVTYMCTDSDGNLDVTARNVIVSPPHPGLPPVLAVVGDLSVSLNSTWSVPDATCTDAEDGGLSGLVWTWSEEDVDTSRAGTYRITYFCVDSADNEAQATVRVTVTDP